MGGDPTRGPRKVLSNSGLPWFNIINEGLEYISDDDEEEKKKKKTNQ